MNFKAPSDVLGNAANMKVLVLLFNSFKHDSRVLKECRSLSRAGCDLELLALFEKALPRREKSEGFQVFRLKLWSRDYIRKIKFLWYFEAVLRMMSYKPRRFDVIHCHDLLGLFPGVLIKFFYALLLKKVKVIYDAHEYETEVNQLKGPKKQLAVVFEKLFIRFVDDVITVSHSIAREYSRKYGITMPHLILNCPAKEQLPEKRRLLRDKLHLNDGQRLFLYQGGLSIGRGIEFLLEAFRGLGPKNVLVFMGYGPLEQLVKSAAKEQDNVFFVEAVAPQDLIAHTTSADVGLLFYENNCLNHYFCTPNKFFEYTMAEIPVVVSSDLYELPKLVERHQIGFSVPMNDVLALRQCVDNLSEDQIIAYKQNAQAIRDQYSWEEQEKILLRLYGLSN